MTVEEVDVLSSEAESIKCAWFDTVGHLYRAEFFSSLVNKMNVESRTPAVISQVDQPTNAN